MKKGQASLLFTIVIAVNPKKKSGASTCAALLHHDENARRHRDVGLNHNTVFQERCRFAFQVMHIFQVHVRNRSTIQNIKISRSRK
ncbi:hypothetical protein NC653_001769 [Populus alba x Populus x berolinensis]|uniref:Uncharacterized protein n=1 Tax=Populus alba x Populus x berolinensis TaxID=444605 RepID=A0AAD6WG07_9ROSI|nr:hypothetical protein NC653_001769 [Populus alba x Populus x berolinensis]